MTQFEWFYHLKIKSQQILIVKEQLKDQSLKLNTTIQPVFASRKIEQELNVKEAKPRIVNEQCVVYNFRCDLCDAGYVGYTREHLHNRVKDINNSPLQERARDDPSGPAETFRSA